MAYASYVSTNPQWTSPNFSTVIYADYSFTASWGDDVYYWEAYNNGWPGWQALSPASYQNLPLTAASLGWGPGAHALAVVGWNGSSWGPVAQTPFILLGSAPTSVSISAPASAATNQVITISWNAANATSYSYIVSGTTYPMGSATSYTGTPASIGFSVPGTYAPAVQACNGSGCVTNSISLTVTAPVPTITSFTSSSTNLPAGGGSVTLTWASANTTSCSASGGWSGAKTISGSETISSVTSMQTFNLTCQ